MRMKKASINGIVLMIVIALALSACSGQPATSEGENLGSGQAVSLKLGFAKCAHCLPMSLTPDFAENVQLEPVNFANGNDVLTALVSKSIDIAQVTYMHYITALDKGFDVIAISGQVNGGTEMLSAPGLGLKAGDWEGLKSQIQAYKDKNASFRIGVSRGSPQDIQLRGELKLHGIDPVKDVQIVNISNPSDHAATLKRGEVEMLSTVEPFASQIRLDGTGISFALPYDQASGKLTNLIVTRQDVIDRYPKEVEETVGALVKLVTKLDQDKAMWLQAINKYTVMDDKIGNEALKNAFPDYKMYRNAAIATANMMKELNYISKDVSDQVEQHMNYQFLSNVTGKPKEELGFE